jgi:hypothetical protein
MKINEMKRKFDETNLHFWDYIPIEENIIEFVDETEQRMKDISKRTVYHKNRSEYLQNSKLIKYKPKMSDFRKAIKSQLRVENILATSDK